jgi:hypothetical protein
VPSVIFEDTVSGTGESIMGGTRVYYVAWEVTTEGPTIHRPNSWDVDSVVRVGHWELGNDLAPLGLISGIGYGEQHWMNALSGQRIVIPTLSGADFTALLAQYIRWAIAPGTEVHIYVFGDS